MNFTCCSIRSVKDLFTLFISLYYINNDINISDMILRQYYGDFTVFINLGKDKPVKF